MQTCTLVSRNFLNDFLFFIASAVKVYYSKAKIKIEQHKFNKLILKNAYVHRYICICRYMYAFVCKHAPAKVISSKTTKF